MYSSIYWCHTAEIVLLSSSEEKIKCAMVKMCKVFKYMHIYWNISYLKKKNVSVLVCAQYHSKDTVSPPRWLILHQPVLLTKQTARGSGICCSGLSYISVFIIHFLHACISCFKILFPPFTIVKIEKFNFINPGKTRKHQVEWVWRISKLGCAVVKLYNKETRKCILKYLSDFHGKNRLQRCFR